jgi:hypothetical protein
MKNVFLFSPSVLFGTIWRFNNVHNKVNIKKNINLYNINSLLDACIITITRHVMVLRNIILLKAGTGKRFLGVVLEYKYVYGLSNFKISNIIVI